MARKRKPIDRVRLIDHPPALVKLQYPKLAKGTHVVLERIDDPAAYDGPVLGIEYGKILAWVYERHTVSA